MGLLTAFSMFNTHCEFPREGGYSMQGFSKLLDHGPYYLQIISWGWCTIEHTLGMLIW